LTGIKPEVSSVPMTAVVVLVVVKVVVMGVCWPDNVVVTVATDTMTRVTVVGTADAVRVTVERMPEGKVPLPGTVTVITETDGDEIVEVTIPDDVGVGTAVVMLICFPGKKGD